MREIKFRAWYKAPVFSHVSEGKHFYEEKWFKGDEAILLTHDGKYMMAHHHCMHVDKNHENYRRKWDLGIRKNNNGYIVEQYTGLKDKNGKRYMRGMCFARQCPGRKLLMEEICLEV
jgi:hypothetical protein